MEIQKCFLEIIRIYQNHELLAPYDPGHWNYFLRSNGYVESSDNDNWNEDAEAKGYHINPGISEAIFNNFQSRCKFKIPDILKDTWLQSDGFIVKKGSIDNSGLYKMPLQFGLLPMEAAFGGAREIRKMHEVKGNDKLLQWTLLNPDLFKDILEFGFVKPGKVGISGLLKNCIFLELFSSDIFASSLFRL